MLNAEQNRNFDRCKRLHVFLDNNAAVYSTYLPFNKEKQSFTSNFQLFKSYTPQKEVKGTAITTGQKELKANISKALLNICATATSYAEEYNNPQLAAAVKCTKSDIGKCKDADVYGKVLNIVNTLQPLLSDAHFMEYDITSDALNSLMSDATAFSDNLGTASVIDSGSSIANKNINDVIKQLDKNVEQFNRLINRFAASHPDFVAGYRINAALETPATRHTGVEGIVTEAATGKPVQDAVVTITGKDKEALTDGTGSYSIISMYGGEYEMVVTAPGFTAKTMALRVHRGKITKLNIAL